MHLAVGTKGCIKIYEANKGVVVDGIYEMKEEFKYQTKSNVVNIKFVEQANGAVPLLVAGTHDGTIILVDFKETYTVAAVSLKLDPADALASFSADLLPDSVHFLKTFRIVCLPVIGNG